MFYCLNCQSRFDTPELERWGNAITNVCPHCRDNDYIKLVPCQQCSEPKEDNGDKYCRSCEGEVDKEISDAINDMKMRWDAELVDEAITIWIENL